ncbi:MAG: Gfo/Idh/MocA family oxidoreductase [Firmicutes bacterium]|nr:Gfo/Idh/MocA family oxidoreductase [Bacillota bacterium]
MFSDRTIRWGVISAYGIANKRTIPAMIKLPDTKVIGVTSQRLGEAEEIAKKYGCPYYFDRTDDLLALPELDAVYIASPVFLHYENVVKAAKAKKHILCEKPMALTIDQCKEIDSLCRKQGVKFMIGFMMRFHGAHRKVKEMIDSGIIGKPIMARAQLSHYKVEWGPNGERTWRQSKELAGGGSLMDMGIHCIDLLRYWLGEVVEVSAFVDTLDADYNVEDTATVLLKFKSGAHGIVDSCFNVKGARHVFEVYGTKGCLRGEETIGQLPEGRLFANLDGEETKLEFPIINMYSAEVGYLNQCIREDREPFLNACEGTRNQEIVFAAYRASEGRRVIKV